MEDTYRTISAASTGLYKEKGSKFMAFAYPVNHEDEIKEILQQLRKEYHDARHHCYAYRLGADKTNFRANDDGEPSNSAGKPILGQIQSYDITNVLIVVIRYFGGILLGVGGLIHAYKDAAADAIRHARIITKTVDDVYRIEFRYEQMNDIMRIIKEEQLQIKDQHFDLSCRIDVCLRQKKVPVLKEKTRLLNHVKIIYLTTL